jgi:conjugation system TraG family ATPase
MQAQLDERLPILEVADDCIVSKMGDVTVCLEVGKPEIFTLSPEEYERLHGSFVKAMKLLPQGTVFHMQDIYIKEKYRADRAKLAGTFLESASERFFDGRPFLRHTCRIFLTCRPEGRRAVSSATSGLLRGRLVPSDTLNAMTVHEFEDSVSQFSRVLTDSKMVTVRRIPTTELTSTPKKAGVIEQYCYLSDEGDELLVRDIDLGSDLRIGDRHCQLFTLADTEHLPSRCAPAVKYAPYSNERSKLYVGFAAGMGLLLNCNHIYNQYVVIEDGPATIKKLESKRLRLQSLSAYSRENAISHEATNAFLNEAIASQRQPVKAHFNVLAWGEGPDELKDIRNQVSSAMAAIDAVAHLETIGCPQLWWAGIPGNGGDLPVNECFDTFLEQACCFLAVETNYRSTSSSFGLRFGDRLTGRPVMVDIDLEPRKENLTGNGNLFVLSGSGGGKSFLMNHLCRSYWEKGMHIVIVDVGHSYQMLCAMLGGFYFTYDEDNPLRFNPFFIEPGEVFDTEKKESLKSLLLTLWKKHDEDHERSEYVALSNGLQLFYEWLGKNPEVFPCFDSFYEFIENQYVDVLERSKVKEKEFDVMNFLYVLRPFYRGGEFHFLLNARENLDLLHKPFIVFELDNIKDHPVLFNITTAVIVELAMAKMRKLRGIWKMVVIEEAWKAIASSGMAENIKYWAKTLRKFMGKLALVTQEVEDIISSPIIKQAIINNSDTKILLDQSKFQNKFDEIQALLGLSDKQKAEIMSINRGHDPGRQYKDCWIGLGPTHSRVYRLETSLEEYLTYTSDQGEKVKIEAYAKQYGSVRKGIEALAAEVRAGK